MDFNSKETNSHIIQPIAYNQIRKICKPRARIHSAYDQYSIHCLAYEFVSDHLKIPKPHSYEGRAYTMDQIMDNQRIHNYEYSNFPELFVDLISFAQYMISNGYWPYNFSIFSTGPSQFILLDFSQFGCIDRNKVRFPKLAKTYTLDEAAALYGIHMYEDIDVISMPLDVDIFDELMLSEKN